MFFFLMIRRPPRSTLFPDTTSSDLVREPPGARLVGEETPAAVAEPHPLPEPVVSTGAGSLPLAVPLTEQDRKSTRLNSSHANTSSAVFCLQIRNAIDTAATRRTTSA